MDKTFGDYFVRCKLIPPPEAAEAEEEQKEEVPEHEFYEKVPIDEVLVKTSTSFVAVLFTAEYCPPCQGFLQQFQDFIAEANKDAQNPKF